MTREQFAPGSAPLVRDRDREIVSTATGNRTRLVLDSDATGGAVSVLSVYLPQGANGAAPHLHTRSTELFYVVSGRLEILAGDRIEILEQGDTLLVPRLMPHAFGATGNSDVNVLTVLSPRCAALRLLPAIGPNRAPAGRYQRATGGPGDL
ncbi:cupin [Mycobacteroides abscessus subsp. abscessus]|nr:cupin [Mycobacteroides abscessus subsp. abscessus]SIA56137.1 cupin [Mycobacteroides abscessus subsp. abscessus]SKQ97847.1 cupin [Mycobacteroides abscessus subsp. abscessus]